MLFYNYRKTVVCRSRKYPIKLTTQKKTENVLVKKKKSHKQNKRFICNSEKKTKKKNPNINSGKKYYNKTLKCVLWYVR